jgi:hypothetical protein
MEALKKARLTGLLPAAVFVALVASPLAAKQAEAAVSVPVVGNAIGGGTFTGTFDLQKFTVKNGVVMAVGTVSGTLTTATESVSVVKNVTTRSKIVEATCDILRLDLGPIFLDVLGLQVNLSRVILDIDAQAGAGNLLGNLLCAVAGLLDNPSGLAKLLNQVLDVLA